MLAHMQENIAHGMPFAVAAWDAGLSYTIRFIFVPWLEGFRPTRSQD